MSCDSERFSAATHIKPKFGSTYLKDFENAKTTLKAINGDACSCNLASLARIVLLNHLVGMVVFFLVGFAAPQQAGAMLSAVVLQVVGLL